MPSRADLIAAMSAELKANERQRKSDDIVAFMARNWKLFAHSRNEISVLSDELSDRGDMSVAALCEALELPRELLFRRTKLVDMVKLMVDFGASDVCRVFTRLREAAASEGRSCTVLCLVTPTRGVVVTDYPVAVDVAGKSLLSYKPAEGEGSWYVFPAEQMPYRIRSMFREARERLEGERQ